MSRFLPVHIMNNIMRWSRGTWLYIFLFSELAGKKKLVRQLIYYHVFIIRYSTHSFAENSILKYLNLNVRECDIGFQNAQILLHD